MENKPYRKAFDTSYAVHQGLIHKLARKGFGRLMQAGVTIDYEDVFQEMSLTYVKAVRKYNPELGISFTAYLGRAIWNQFNLFAEQEIGHSSEVSSIDEMSEGSEVNDLYEAIDGGSATPEQYLEVKQSWAVNSIKCGSVAKLIVRQIMNPSEGLLTRLKEKQKAAVDDRNTGQNPKAHAARNVTVAMIAQYHEISVQEMRMAKKNLNSVYGVNIR